MEFLVRLKWILTSVIILLIIAGFPYFKKALIPNNELSLWFVDNDPTLKAYQNFCDRYGNDRLIMILAHDPEGIFQHEKIQQIKKITQQVVEVEGVKNVQSLTNIKDLFRIRINDTLRIRYESPFLNKNTEDTDTMNKIRDQVLASSTFVDQAINEAGNSTIILIQLNPFDEIDSRRGIVVDEIEAIARDLFRTDDIYMGGLDIFTNELNTLSKHDFGLFMGITYLIMFLLILIFFRKWAYVFLALITMLASVMLTLSIYGFTGHQLNIFSLVIPPLIVILGLINILHIINEYEFSANRNEQHRTREAILNQSLKKVFKPCLYTALTTMIGFLSLLSSSTAILREFGLFAAIGILIVFICSFVFSAMILNYVNSSSIKRNFTSLIGDHLIHISNDIQLNTKKYWGRVF